MADYSLGDTVICKATYDGKLLAADAADFETIASFYIICDFDNIYLTLIPPDLYLANSFVITARDCKEFKLHSKFVGSAVHYIRPEHIVSIKTRLTGLFCIKCNEYYDMAEANYFDENGKGVLICWRCRTYPHFK